MTTVEVTIKISGKAEFGCQLTDAGTRDDLFKGDDFEDAIRKAINDYNDDFRESDIVVETTDSKVIYTDYKGNNNEIST